MTNEERSNQGAQVVAHSCRERVVAQHIADMTFVSSLAGTRWSFLEANGEPECFADRKSIPWNLPTNFHSDLPSFTLRTALSVIPLVSDRCGVDVQ